jgi:hypothetical protein
MQYLAGAMRSCEQTLSHVSQRSENATNSRGLNKGAFALSRPCGGVLCLLRSPYTAVCGASRSSARRGHQGFEAPSKGQQPIIRLYSFMKLHRPPTDQADTVTAIPKGHCNGKLVYIVAVHGKAVEAACSLGVTPDSAHPPWTLLTTATW